MTTIHTRQLTTIHTRQLTTIHTRHLKIQHVQKVNNTKGKQHKVVKKIKTTSLWSVTFFLNRAVYEIMWKNTVESDRPQMTIWRTRIAR